MLVGSMERRALDDFSQLVNELLEQSLVVDRHMIVDESYLGIPAIRQNKLDNISRYKENINNKKFAAHDMQKRGRRDYLFWGLLSN
jgi:hypothetical protein